MMVWSINLFVLAIGIFIVGMFRPQWILFWMEKPIRMPITMLSAVLFMCGAVMFGEANKEKQKFQKQATLQVDKKQSDAVPVVDEVKK
jgi:predicted membrane channel-forming protein YqfA (hemolysin III family)